MDSISFGKKIAFLRKKNEMTQTQLAEKLNVTNKAVSRWETGEGYPEITLLKPLAEILNTNVDYLLSSESVEANKSGNLNESNQWKNSDESNQSRKLGESNKLNQFGESNHMNQSLASEKKRLLKGIHEIQSTKYVAEKLVYIPKFNYSKMELLLVLLSIFIFSISFLISKKFIFSLPEINNEDLVYTSDYVYGMIKPIKICGLTGSFWFAMTVSLVFYCVSAIIFI